MTLTIEVVRVRQTQLEIRIEDLIKDFNESTSLKVEELVMSYNNNGELSIKIKSVLR